MRLLFRNLAAALLISSTVLAQQDLSKSPSPNDLIKMAEEGDAPSQARLGRALLDGGLGGQKNVADGLKWIRRAADQDNAYAEGMLGSIYAKGDVVAKDDIESTKWYRRAAEHGAVQAQFLVGLSYALGIGVPQDNTESIRWYRKAADQGNATALTQLRNRGHKESGST